MIKQLKELTEQELTWALDEAEAALKLRKNMRGNSTLKSEQAWVDEAAVRVRFIRQEIAARAGHAA